MVPEFQQDGNLPPGIHLASLEEIESRFAWNDHRQRLLSGLRRAIVALRAAGCRRLYLDGSFVTSKACPSDYDCCWEMLGVDHTALDRVFLDFRDGRLAQKTKFLGEFFPEHHTERATNCGFLSFFQIDKESGEAKGIVALDI